MKLSSSRINDRRHLSELNQEKNFTSNREPRLNSVERENNKLVSPEKVLSLRRNSSAAGADGNRPSQPLSSLITSNNNDDDLANSPVPPVARTASRNANDYSSLESKRYESVQEGRSSSNHFQNSSNYHTTATSNHVESKRSIIDSASNVKGSTFFSNFIKYVKLIVKFQNSVIDVNGSHSIPAWFVGCNDKDGNCIQSGRTENQFIRCQVF